MAIGAETHWDCPESAAHELEVMGFSQSIDYWVCWVWIANHVGSIGGHGKNVASCQ